MTLVWASMLVRDLPQQKKRDSDPPTLVVSQAKKKDSKDGESNFWSEERAGCVCQMAKFLRTLVQMRKISHDVVGTSSRLRSSFFSSSSGGGSSSSKVSTGILDVVAAKDVATNLYESLPVPAQGKGTAVKVGEEGGDKSKDLKVGQVRNCEERIDARYDNFKLTRRYAIDRTRRRRPRREETTRSRGGRSCRWSPWCRSGTSSRVY